ncbi:hypothetical protein ebA4898 [Aromatoleum aromaticum EbN1]|uniref:Uncharacterized protein n=1 Tax=Aromatoleum aromaticum (strain DSM 19018 / LMG 30748 / EbN1) TaxID=76114 RepID=Q5P1A2_AROAE|nr:hypothetical protein ebA4898 [Aromatoleum aromaticum EbN1]
MICSSPLHRLCQSHAIAGAENRALPRHPARAAGCGIASAISAAGSSRSSPDRSAPPTEISSCAGALPCSPNCTDSALPAVPRCQLTGRIARSRRRPSDVASVPLPRQKLPSAAAIRRRPSLADATTRSIRLAGRRSSASARPSSRKSASFFIGQGARPVPGRCRR